jgi:hypothetical protein
MALSDLKIRKAEIREKPYKLSDGGGLFVLVKPNGSKLWQQKYRHLGKERLLSHGQYPNVTLAQARKKRDGARTMVADGGDPTVQKRLDQIQAETLSRTTFLLVAEKYLQAAYDRELAEATMLKTRREMSLSIPQALAGALVVLAGLPSILQPFPFPIPLSLTLGLLLPDLLLRRT